MKILLFHAHDGDPLSFAIKALTRSQYCHAAVLIEKPEWIAKFKTACGVISDGDLLVEAYYPKVHARLIQDSEKPSIDVFKVDVSPEIEEAAMTWLEKQLGVSYDITDLFRFLPEVRAFAGETNPQAYMQHTFCSMLVFNTYRFAGLPLLQCHDYECSPDKLPWSPFVLPVAQLLPGTQPVDLAGAGHTVP